MGEAMIIACRSTLLLPCVLFLFMGGDGGPFIMAEYQSRDSRRLSPAGAGQTPAPAITQPVMFNTPEADRILSELQIFPPDNPWNEDISKRPVAPNSTNLIASVGADKSLAYNFDMA